ncbi:MAG TPA: hypothetical protein VFI53_05125 [Myxococcaceae bacterium]|nr:hypothetical protein [Myxococcaceae bacterium]
MRTRFHLCWVCQARILALLLLLLLGVKAFAEPVEAPSPPVSQESPEDAPLADGTSQRSVPDYRGRKPPPTTTGDVLIWGPRVILFPAYLVTNYVIRAPVGGLATEAEKHNWGNAVFDFFAFGPDHKLGIFPVFLFSFGFRPSVGAHFFWDDAFAAGNNFTTDVAYGGSNWITVGLGDRYHFSKDSSLAVEARWDRRPDSLFYGIGSEVSDTFRSRWGSDHVEGSVTYIQVVHRVLRLDAKARIYRTIFRDYECCNDPTIQQRVDAGDYATPPGYGENTTAAELSFKAVLDTRPPVGNRSGFRVGVSAAPGVDVIRGFDRSWIHYGGGIEGSWDVTGTGRVLSLGVIAMFADSLGSQPVPFYELVTVGGAEPFTGFLKGRLRDRSAIGAELSWRWPVFPYLDGVAAVGVGNVFDQHLNNFRFDRLRLNAELGIRTAAALGASTFQFIVGIGSEPFDQGLRITSFSLAFGVTYAL